MKTIQLNPEQFPKISQWNPKHLNKTLEKLSKQANPNQEQITIQDKKWAATMLEMDLQAQSGQILDQNQEEEDQVTNHNKKMLKKMQEEKIPWAESYPGELYPIENMER